MMQSAMLSLLYFLDFSFQSYNVCAIKPVAMITEQMAAWHSEAFFHVGRKLNELVLGGTILSVKNYYWRKNMTKKYLHELNISLQNN